EDGPADRGREVDPDAAVRTAAERDVVVAEAPPDADRRDPQPRALDPPAREVSHRRPEVGPAELDLELSLGAVAEIDPRVVGADAEQDAERQPRLATDADRKARGGHRWSVDHADGRLNRRGRQDPQRLPGRDR